MHRHLGIDLRGSRRTMADVVTDDLEGNIGFDEVLRIVWTMKSPVGITPGTQIDDPVSSVDVLPTLLSVLGYDCEPAHFDGVNALEPIAPRKVFFSGWVPEGPAGYVMDGKKYVHTPSLDEVLIYDLVNDPLEASRIQATSDQAASVQNSVIHWRKSTLTPLDPTSRGKLMVFDNWLCRWNGRDSNARNRLPTL